jgi:hypothetical protein
VLRLDGSRGQVSHHRFQTVQVPPGRARVHSPAGALLAAAVGLDVPAEAGGELRQIAAALVDGSRLAQRAYAADCAALGLTAPLAGLTVSDSERTWWRALSMWTAGDRAAAAAELLRLPPGRYPQRLVLWWRLAATAELPDELRSGVAAAAREFTVENPVTAVAAVPLLRVLGEPCDDRLLVNLIRSSGGGAWLDGMRGESAAARSLAARLDADALRAVLADPAAVPDKRLLEDESRAQQLLERSTLDPTSLTFGAVGTFNERQRGFVARRTLHRAKASLYEWDWPAVLDMARSGLRYARDEAQRDEVRNLFAAAHWQLGNDAQAIAALSDALQGEYTVALQVNFAVVAAELEPQQAAAHLARLVQEAPNLALRISAAQQAVRIWRSDEQLEHGDPLPANLAAALRALVVEPLEYEVFRDLVRLLATHDDDWLARPEALARSPHARSAAAKIWVGNARGPEAFVQELSEALRASSDGWLTELRDQLVQDVIGQLRAPGGPWQLGVLLLEQELPMPPGAWAMLLVLTVGGLLGEIDATTAEPAMKFLDWLEHAHTGAGGLPPAEGEPIRQLLQVPFVALVHTYLVARRHQLQRAYELYESIRNQVAMIPRSMLNLPAIWQAVRPGEELCRSSIPLLERLRRFANADQQRVADDLRDRYQKLLSNFGRLYH